MTTDYYSWPQIIGYIALAIYVAGYACKDDNRLKIVFSISNIFWIAHYHFIHADTAALTTALITLRNVLALNSETFSWKRRLVTAWIFTFLLIISGMVTWAGPISLIPVTACIAATFAMLYLKNLRLRQVLFLTDLGWLVHAVIVGSAGGFVYALSALAMNTLMMVKMRQASPP